MGCSSGIVKQRIEYPATTLKKCEELPKATSGDFPSLFRNHIEVREQGEDCRIHHNALIDFINRLDQSF